MSASLDDDTRALIAEHEAEADPHPGYALESFNYRFTEYTATAATATLDLSLGDNFSVILATAAPTLDFINLPSAGQQRHVALRVVQDASGSRSIGGWKVAGSAITPKYPGGTAPTLTSAANAVDDLHLQLVNISGSYTAYINATGKDWK